MKGHGTHACYVRGCRCADCKAGHARYVSQWEQRRKNPDIWGPSTDLIDAAEVREHLQALTSAGVGKRTIAARSGVSFSVVCRLLGADRSRPAMRVRPETARKLLAVTTAASAYADAGETHRLVDELVASGMRRYQIGIALGQGSGALQLGKTTIRRRSAEAIQALHDLAFWTSPEFRSVCSCVVDEGRRERDRVAKRRERERQATS